MRDLDNLNYSQFNSRYAARAHALEILLERSKSQLEIHRVLILVDLQGLYLSLYNWLSEWDFLLNDAFVMSRFAYFQLRHTFDEIARRSASFYPAHCVYLKDLFDKIKVEEINGQFYIAEEINILENMIFLSIQPSFEIFFAPAPLKDLEWKLRTWAKRGDFHSRHQLSKIKDGIIEKLGFFERNYSIYSEFVDELQRLTENKDQHEGFFNFDVRNGGLKYFDEKEVDTKIVIRTMDALHKSEANSICIVSSDQDFLPLYNRATNEGVNFFQADLAKFRESDRVGRRLREMGKHFIQGEINPDWPLQILTEAMSCDELGQKARYGLDDREISSLAKMHNKMNDWHVNFEIESTGKVKIKLNRPAS